MGLFKSKNGSKTVVLNKVQKVVHVDPVVESFTPDKGSNAGQEVLVLNLNPNARFPFRIGVGKAKLILEKLAYIQAFVEQFDNGNNSDE